MSAETYHACMSMLTRMSWPEAATLAPANAADGTVAAQLLAGVTGWALGDGAYWSATLRADLAADGLTLVAPPR